MPVFKLCISVFGAEKSKDSDVTEYCRPCSGQGISLDLQIIEMLTPFLLRSYAPAWPF